GIDEHLRRVEPMAAPWLERSVDAIGVEQSLTRPVHENVPVAECAMVSRVQPNRLQRPEIVEFGEQQEFHRGGGAAEQRKIHPPLADSGTEGMRLATRGLERTEHADDPTPTSAETLLQMGHPASHRSAARRLRPWYENRRCRRPPRISCTYSEGSC